MSRRRFRRRLRHRLGLRDAAVIGGFHLSGPMLEPIIEPTVAAFDDLQPAVLMPAHCTGWKAVHRFAHRYPDAFVQSAVGTTISP